MNYKLQFRMYTAVQVKIRFAAQKLIKKFTFQHTQLSKPRNECTAIAR